MTPTRLSPGAGRGAAARGRHSRSASELTLTLTLGPGADTAGNPPPHPAAGQASSWREQWGQTLSLEPPTGPPRRPAAPPEPECRSENYTARVAVFLQRRRPPPAAPASGEPTRVEEEQQLASALCQFMERWDRRPRPGAREPPSPLPRAPLPWAPAGAARATRPRSVRSRRPAPHAGGMLWELAGRAEARGPPGSKGWPSGGMVAGFSDPRDYELPGVQTRRRVRPLEGSPVMVLPPGEGAQGGSPGGATALEDSWGSSIDGEGGDRDGTLLITEPTAGDKAHPPLPAGESSIDGEGGDREGTLLITEPTAEDKALVGRAVRRLFQVPGATRGVNRLYPGVVASVRGHVKAPMFLVRYDDGDAEDVTREVLEQILVRPGAGAAA